MDLERCIVVFFADEHFVRMVVPAITTLLEHTPRISAGLLTLEKSVEEDILQQLPPDIVARVLCRTVTTPPHFDSWNPTQYKLDLGKFLDYGLFDTVFWCDADTLTFEDLSPLLGGFVQSDTAFLFTRDHVNADSRFQDLWASQHGGESAPVIPQACFMGFRAAHLRQFLAMWKEEWAQWISPKPFNETHPDPRPHFQWSAFCIEQYALGVALRRYCRQAGLPDDRCVTWFERRMVEIPKSSRRSGTDAVAAAPEETDLCATTDAMTLGEVGIVATPLAASSFSFVSSCSFKACGDAAHNPNVVFIDQFPGFFHYYHQNATSMFEFWKSSHFSTPR